MADYTAEEVQAAVSQLVQSVIASPNGTLGTRRPDVTFAGIQAAAAGIFILYPLAPFYCAYLGAKRLQEAVEEEAAVVESLLEAVGSLNRLVLPVADLTPLANAQAALQALSTAVSNGAPADITKLPQYQRYTSNVSAFLTGPASAVKQGGAIVPTPQEAVAAIPGYITQLQTLHDANVLGATFLANAMTDFASVNLPALVAQGIINNASSVLATDTANLQALSASDRLAALRTPVLNLLTATSTITAFGSFSGPSPFYTVSGTGFPYADATHPATPAVLLAGLGPSYAVTTSVNDTLVFALDSSPPLTVTLPTSTFATLQGTIVEGAPTEGGAVDGYVVGNGTNPTGLPMGYVVPNNNLIHIKVTSVGGPSYDLECVLSPCGNGPPVTRRTAQDIASDINIELTNAGITQFVAEPYFYPSPHYQGLINITPTSGLSAKFDLATPLTSTLAAVVVGDIILVATGPNTGTWNVTVVTSTSEVVATLVSGTPTAQTSCSVVIGPKNRAVRFRFTELQAIEQQWTITIVGDNPTSSAGAQMLGLAPGYSVTCYPCIPSDIISFVNQQQTKLVASSVVSSSTAFSLTTDPLNPFHVIASKLLTTGDLAYVAGSPNTITLSNLSADPTASGVAIGDTLVLRGQGNTAWTITVMTSTSIVATSSNTATDGSSLSFEVGPTLGLAAWQTIQVTSGANLGNYLIASVGPSPLDATLFVRTPIPHYTDPTTSQPIVQPALVGVELLTFASKNTTTASTVAVTGSGVPVLWPSTPATATGTSGFFFLPTPNAGGTPVADDILELFPTTYNVPDSQYVVTTVDSATGGFILGITPNISDVPTTWTFGQIPPPFASLRHGHVVDFVDFQTALNTWLGLPTQQASWFQALNRVINPLLANANPTPSDIGTAQVMITQLAVVLDIADATANNQPADATLEAILGSYTVDNVSQIDTLISTYQAQGGDAAIDVLTSAQFSVFFGLSQDDSSYAGQMQAAMRAVAQNDLPVRKVNRTSSVQSQNTGTSQSPDYEFDTSDTESGMKPDAPADFEKTAGSQ